MSIAKRCLAFSGLFEAELLTELMLRYWNHPFAADADFRSELLERAASALRTCLAGQALMKDIPPLHMNFVAALWYAEWSDVEAGSQDPDRRQWLERVQKALPSCFCGPDRLT
jgi:hypothetical protein